MFVVDNASDAPLPSVDGVEVLRLRRRVTLGAARNEGLTRVDTPYVMFLDADDVLLPGALSALRAELERNGDAVLAAGSVVRWNPVTGSRLPGPLPRRSAVAFQRWPRLLSLIEAARHSVPVTGAALHRTAAARASGGYGDGDWGEDWLFALATTLQGRVVLSREPRKLHRLATDRESMVMKGRDDRARVVAAARGIRHRLATDPASLWFTRALLPLYALLHTVTGRRIDPRPTRAHPRP